MADVVLPVVGAAVGFVVGGPQGAMIGAQAGMMAASAFTRVKLPTQEGPRLADLRGQTSTYGGNIPKLYGTMRIAGNVIWSTDIKEVKVESTQNGGGKGGGGRTSQTSITYEYYITLAIALCEGEIDEIIRVWADAKILTEDILLSNQGKYNVHLCLEDQDIDDIMAKYIDSSILPAYRGTAYIVIEDFPLADYGNRIPNFSFEVRRSIRFTPSLEDKITDIVMIPGAGEMVYGTEVTTKQDGFFWSLNNRFIPSGDIQNINMHNYEGKADVLLSLDNMQQILSNLEWVAVVVTWFATSTDAGTCRIVPKVEFYGSTLVLPQDWSVNGLDRETAERVLFFDADTPTYGGTPSDHTVVQLCEELRARGLKVMLYPMIFVDQITPVPKPWRGRIEPSSASDANNWFTKTDGYNEFILHYANLVANKVDAFVIGSELIGMTGYTDSPGNYPAVNQLINLAGSVKAIMGSNTQITYAADWSEYHSKDGIFNLDPLWQSPNIDFIGIDSYFPITPDLPQTQITEELIKQYWEDGEGWRYYYTDPNARTGKTVYIPNDGTSPYAWKNLEQFWNSYRFEGSQNYYSADHDFDWSRIIL